MCKNGSRSDGPPSDRLYFLRSLLAKKLIENNSKFETAIGQTADRQTGFRYSLLFAYDRLRIFSIFKKVRYCLKYEQ